MQLAAMRRAFTALGNTITTSGMWCGMFHRNVWRFRRFVGYSNRTIASRYLCPTCGQYREVNQ